MALGRRTPGHGQAVRDPHGRRHFRQPLAAKPLRGLVSLGEKHEGELVELEGWWEKGHGGIPDALFDPQFARDEEDYKFCKGLGKGGESYQRSKYADEYRVVDRLRRAEGRKKDKGEGRAGQPAVGGGGGGGGKGKPAVCSKSHFVRERGLPFESNILW